MQSRQRSNFISRAEAIKIVELKHPDSKVVFRDSNSKEYIFSLESKESIFLVPLIPPITVNKYTGEVGTMNPVLDIKPLEDLNK